MIQTKKLLEGLGGDGVNVRSLANYTKGQGVYVFLNIGRKRGTIPLPKQLIGLNKMGDEAKAAWESYVSLGNIRFIPAEDEAKLQAIEGSLRYQLHKRTLSNGFMPMEKYLVFKTIFENVRDDYLAERDHILSKWPDLVASFTEAIDTILKENKKMLKRDKISLRKELLAKIPSKESYGNSFLIRLMVETFPDQPDVTDLPPELSGDVLATWKEATVQNAVECIASLTQEVFDLCSHCASRYAERGEINGNNLNALISMSQRIQENNLFQNPILKDASALLKTLATTQDADDQEEIVENVLVSLYQYGKETGMELEIGKKGLSKEALEAMASLKATP